MKGIFILGAAGYPLLELLYRGRTHYSMALAGGCSAALIGKISRLPLPLPAQALLCGAGITAVEALCGVIWNRHYAVWDYRRMPLNWRGQVCLPYSVLWCGLSALLLIGLRMTKQVSRS